MKTITSANGFKVNLGHNPIKTGKPSRLNQWSEVMSTGRRKLVKAFDAGDDKAFKKYVKFLNAVADNQRETNLHNGMPGESWKMITEEETKAMIDKIRDMND